MQIGGLIKSSLLDWPGKLSCVVFTVGCNFRCGFCHNKDLVSEKLFEKSGLKGIEEKDFFEFLEKKKRILDAVVITGGEPTMQRGLVEFCRKIKTMGLAVKLDTNGSRPEVVEQLIRSKYIDYVAMDYKTQFASYSVVVGNADLRSLQKTIEIIISSGIDFELRTTVVPGIHTQEVLRKMGKEIGEILGGPARSPPRRTAMAGRWFWQDFRPENCLDESYLKKKGYGKEKLEKWKKAVEKEIKGIRIEVR